MKFAEISEKINNINELKKVFQKKKIPQTSFNKYIKLRHQ